MAQIKDTIQIKTDTSKDVPILYELSYIKGVTKLFNAFPNYGKVIAIPNANANYFPLNQKDTKDACAVTKL